MSERRQFAAQISNMKKTALQKLLAYIRTYHSREPELIEYAETLIEDEREQIVAAWVKGNAEGWTMTTDWPEHGERYYVEKYGKAKTSTH